MPNVRQLKDHGDPIFPITHVSLVKGMEYRALMDATYAWDGTGAPDVSKIPAGVVVTYDGTDYTGTLVASASTTGRFYLVPSTTVQGEWDRYMTDGSGSSYAWKAAGNTSIPSPNVVDNETTDDPTRPHSAAGGKRLKDQVDELDLEVNKLANLSTENLWLPVGGTFSTAGNCILLNVSGAKSYKFVGPVSGSSVFAFLKSFPQDGVAADYATGASRIVKTNGADIEGSIPSDAVYMYVSATYSGASWIPSSLIIDGYDYVKGVHGEIAGLKSKDNDLFLGTIIPLVYAGTNQNQYTNWEVGDIWYNSYNSTVRRCKKVDGSGGNLDNEAFVPGKDTIFSYHNLYFVFVQATGKLALVNGVIELKSITDSTPLTAIGELYYSSANKIIRVKTNVSPEVLVTLDTNPHTIFCFGNSLYRLDSSNNLVQISGGGEVVSSVWDNFNAESLVYNPKNPKSIVRIPLSSWRTSHPMGSISGETTELWDEISRKYVPVRLCTSANSSQSNDGAVFIAPLGSGYDMTKNVLRGAIWLDTSFDVTNLRNINLSLYSDNHTSDSTHRAYILLNAAYNGNVNYIRSGWFHFCVNIPVQSISTGESFDATNVTHIGFTTNSASGTTLVSAIAECDIVPYLRRPGIVTIVDNFGPNVPAMADYAFSKGVKLNLSIIPNWIENEDPNSGTLQQVYAAAAQGHLIINHTWNHQISGGQSPAEVFDQVSKADRWMVERGLTRGAKILSNPSAAFDNDKYNGYFESEALSVFHHWTTMFVPTQRGDDSTQCILYYPYKGTERTLNISLLDSYFTSDFTKLVPSALLGANAAINVGGILVCGFHGYGTEYGGYMPDDTTWKAYIDAIAELNLHHYTIDELLEGAFI